MKKFPNHSISVVAPSYNESANLEPFINEVSNVIQELEIKKYEIIIVDDGSSDDTVSIVSKITQNNPHIKLISLSRNFGNQNALRAGLEHASYEYVLSIDADLQQPPALIKDMLLLMENGNDMVLTQRVDLKVDFRVLAARFFYGLINLISSVPISYGSSDFRLMNRKSLNALLRFNEFHAFYRGVIPLIGFRNVTLQYSARDRLSGKSKLSLKKLINLALNGITASTIMPLRISTLFGLIVSMVAFSYLIYVLYAKIVLNDVISGWSSLIISILFLGGIQLIMLGIIGEYLGKTFFEVKNRPSYIIKSSIGVDDKSY